MAIGNGAEAGLHCIAIGAHAKAGVSESWQLIDMLLEILKEANDQKTIKLVLEGLGLKIVR